MTDDHRDTSPPWRDALAAGKAEEALKRYLEAEAHDEATLDALAALADVRRHLRAKAFTRAQQALERSGQPEGLLDWHALSTQIGTLKESNDALDTFKPDEAMALLASVDEPLLQGEAETQRGTAKVYLNENAEAEAHFANALEHDAKHYRALTNQGNLALEKGEVDAAIAAYEQALEINENFANAHHNLGVAYRKKGDIGKSVASIRRAQRALRRQDSEEARGKLSTLTGGRGGLKLGRWLFYGAVIALAYFVLRGQGVI